jgi:hypothetical protein
MQGFGGWKGAQEGLGREVVWVKQGHGDVGVGVGVGVRVMVVVVVVRMSSAVGREVRENMMVRVEMN